MPRSVDRDPVCWAHIDGHSVSIHYMAGVQQTGPIPWPWHYPPEVREMHVLSYWYFPFMPQVRCGGEGEVTKASHTGSTVSISTVAHFPVWQHWVRVGIQSAYSDWSLGEWLQIAEWAGYRHCRLVCVTHCVTHWPTDIINIATHRVTIPWRNIHRTYVSSESFENSGTYLWV